MVAADQEAALPCGRQQAGEFALDRLFAFVHDHFVVSAEQEELRVFAPQSGNVHAGLTLERKDSVDSRPLEPADRAGDVTVRIEKNLDVVLPENRNDFAVVRQQEFIEKLFGDHRAVVVAHILRKAHEFGFIAVEDAVRAPSVEFELVLVQAAS